MGMGPHTQCQRRSNRGWKQASLSFRNMKYYRVLIHRISSQMPCRPWASICQMGCLQGQAGIDPVTVFNTRTKQGDRKKSQGSDICTPQLFSMVGGSEDLWADTSPWMLPGTDLFALFPPWSGVQGYRLTQGPLKTISKQWRNTTHHF